MDAEQQRSRSEKHIGGSTRDTSGSTELGPIDSSMPKAKVRTETRIGGGIRDTTGSAQLMPTDTLMPKSKVPDRTHIGHKSSEASGRAHLMPTVRFLPYHSCSSHEVPCSTYWHSSLARQWHVKVYNKI